MNSFVDLYAFQFLFELMLMLIFYLKPLWIRSFCVFNVPRYGGIHRSVIFGVHLNKLFRYVMFGVVLTFDFEIMIMLLEVAK